MTDHTVNITITPKGGTAKGKTEKGKTAKGGTTNLTGKTPSPIMEVMKVRTYLQLGYVVLSPMGSILDISVPKPCIGHGSKPEHANNFTLNRLLHNLCASSNQQFWAKKLEGYMRLPILFNFGSFRTRVLDFHSAFLKVKLPTKKESLDEATEFLSKTAFLSDLIQNFLNLFKLKPNDIGTDVKPSFMKVSSDTDGGKKSKEKKEKRKKTAKDAGTAGKAVKGLEEKDAGSAEEAVNQVVEDPDQIDMAIILTLMSSMLERIEKGHEQLHTPVVSSNVGPFDFLQGVDPDDAVFAFILAVFTNDSRDGDEDEDGEFNFLQVFDELKDCGNAAEVLFTFKPLLKSGLAFSKEQIRASKKQEELFVSMKEVNTFLLQFLRQWNRYDWNGNRKTSKITELFNEVLHGIALLSAGFPPRQMHVVPSTVNMALALFHHVLMISCSDLLDTDLDGEFFQMVAEFLGFTETQLCICEYNMSGVQTYVDMFKEKWEKVGYLAGLSNDRDEILAFLRAIYKRQLSGDLKGNLIILKTFIGSGKTASLCLLILLMLQYDQSAVFMTPCPSEIINFFFGIKFQIDDLYDSEGFKSLSQSDPFRESILELRNRLDKLTIFNGPLSLFQLLEKDSINIFVLDPTEANIAWVVGNKYDMVVCDDIRNAGDIAKVLSSNGSKYPIFVSGADTKVFYQHDFSQHGYTIDYFNIMKPVDIESIWANAKINQEREFFGFLNKLFGTLRYSELKKRLLNIGISVKGDVQFCQKEASNMKEFLEFLKNVITGDYHDALVKFKDHYCQQNLMRTLSETGIYDTTILYDKNDIISRVHLMVASFLSVEDSNYVPPIFSLDKSLGKESAELEEVAEKKKRKEKNGSKTALFRKVATLPQQSQSKPDSEDDVKRKEKECSSLSIAQLDAEKEQLVPNCSHQILRPATPNDIRIGTPIVGGNQLLRRPSKLEIQRFKELLTMLDVSTSLKKEIQVLFEWGVGIVSRDFLIEFNNHVVSVVRMGRLSFLGTDYPLESMNLGRINKLIVMSSISMSDLGQLYGRKMRPNCTDSLILMLEDLKLEGSSLILLTFDESYLRDERSVLSERQSGHNFGSVLDITRTLNVERIGQLIKPVLDRVFSDVSLFFTIEFQQLVDLGLKASIFRCFHGDLHLSDTTVLGRDCVTIIGSIVDTKQFPIKPCSSTTVMMNKIFGTTSPDTEKFFDPFANLFPLLCATTQHDLQGVDTLESIIKVIAQLSKAHSVVSCMMTILSLTTPTLTGKSDRDFMMVLASIIQKTQCRLVELISLLEIKKGTILQNLEKAGSKIGAVVYEKAVDQNSKKFADLATDVLDKILDEASSDRFSEAISEVQDFLESISSDKPDANRSLIEKAMKLIAGLRDLSASFSTFQETSHDLNQRLHLTKSLRGVLLFRLMTMPATSGKGVIPILPKLLQVPSNESSVVRLGIPSVMNKKNFLHQDHLNKLYCELRSFLMERRFLNDEQCVRPNEDNQVPKGSFEALKNAMTEFDASHKFKFQSDASKNDDEASLAEITVEIDGLQQEISSHARAFDDKFGELRWFTKMG